MFFRSTCADAECAIVYGVAETTQAEIETAFKTYTKRPDVAVVIINQKVASDFGLYRC